MKVWQTLGFIIAGLAVSSVVMANPVGTWRTIDDKTGRPKSLVKITQEGGKYVGRVVDTLDSPRVCEICEGEFHGKDMIGQTILWGVKSKGGNNYGDGRIQDPRNGNTYNASLIDNGNTLSVRGSILGIGRSQTWQRVK